MFDPNKNFGLKLIIFFSPNKNYQNEKFTNSVLSNGDSEYCPKNLNVNNFRDNKINGSIIFNINDSY